MTADKLGTEDALESAVIRTAMSSRG